MPVAYIRYKYNMPKIKRGLKVLYDGKKGRIVSFLGNYIHIKMEEDGRSFHVHPKDDKLVIKYND